MSRRWLMGLLSVLALGLTPVAWAHSRDHRRVYGHVGVPLRVHPGARLWGHYRFHHVDRDDWGDDDGGFYFGVGPAWGWGPWWAAPPPVYYSSPPVIVSPPPPVTYISPGGASQSAQYWYFCRGSKAYYPYVKKCPGGWMKVVPQRPRDAR